MLVKKILQFHRSVLKWPKTPLEAGLVAEGVEQLTEAPFVAVLLKDQQNLEDASPLFGFRIHDESLRLRNDASAPLLTQFPDVAVLAEEFIRHSVQADSALNEGFRQIRVTGPFLRGLFLGILPISNSDYSSSEKSRGWVFIALPSEWTSSDQLLIFLIAQKLADLAQCAGLEKEIETRSQFLSIASHELKTPLTSIYGLLQLQERALRLNHEDPMIRDPEQQLLQLQRMIRQVERLNELIDGLLDISRIQNNRFHVDPSEVDVAELLRETMTFRIDTLAREAGVSVHVDAPQSLHARVDPVRLEQLITNLAMNAVRFSPEGGGVWVRLREEAEAFHLTFRDQGPGISAEDRERIFHPFERAQRTSRLGGLGLGLYISRQIALLHGGNVAVLESIPGKGNLIEAYFPKSELSSQSA